MAHYRTIRNAATGAVVLPHAQLRTNFFGHSRGLMFYTSLRETDGLLFVYGTESTLLTAIGMLFMFFPIAVVWLDKDGVVVDKVLAKLWRLSYTPRKPARYFIEARPSLLDRVQIGDRLVFDQPASL